MLQGYYQSDIAASELVHAVAVGEVVMAHLSFVKQSELVAVRDQHSVSVSAPDQLCLVAEFRELISEELLIMVHLLEAEKFRLVCFDLHHDALCSVPPILQ
jgi:hypothetical protein